MLRTASGHLQEEECVDERWRSRLLNLGRMPGSVEDEAALIRERVRVGEVRPRQALLAAAADIPAAVLATGDRPGRARRRLEEVLPKPSWEELYLPVHEQMNVVWQLNEQFSWGFSANDFVSLPFPGEWPDRWEAIRVLVPYLATVPETFDALWRATKSRHGHRKRAADDSRIKADELYLRLAEGIRHPGKRLRWETLDVFSYRDSEEGLAPRTWRGMVLPHAGLLAAAAIHVRWVQAMDGIRVPHVWLAGYQCRSEPDADWSNVPFLHLISIIKYPGLSPAPETRVRRDAVMPFFWDSRWNLGSR